jgi:hypothetical protein
MFPTQIERRRAERALAEYANGFKLMDGDRQFANVDGCFTIALLGGQPIGIDRHLDLEREMIPIDVAAGRQEIKRVLLNVQGSFDLRFEI